MATIKDVANDAGLSVTTVSRYLNNHPYISEDNKMKIKNSMIKLDYMPNSSATQLRANKTFTIGVIVSRITNPFFSYLIDAIDKVVKQTPYHTLIMQSYDDVDEEVRLLDMLKQKNIDGIIMASLENDLSVIKQYQKYGQIVLIGDKSLAQSDIPTIGTEQEEATYHAIQFLLNKGYTDIAYCTGGHFLNTKHGSSRDKGYIRALADNHIELNNKRIYTNIHTIEDGKHIASSVIAMSQKDRPTSIFAGSDEVAAGIIQTFEANDLNVPSDVAVMGYDNQPFSSMVSVPITTVSQPVEAIGQEATHLLMSLLDDKNYDVDVDKLKLKIVERLSV
ncbi:LacI family DNA-binding transcriptional regulator [Staphylococcus succinus]|uniref:LacI family DNA-binding transcriptional regulator n=1 Tax=Staphylococcus succinus TaxID=61015 RepID=UPI001C05259A|nr:LacI family DNA-binding transcriptional regulator [Staphylococcus succinus]MBU0439326.1 LacI family transcriptional regulator [Staphylococcus succinus]